MDKASNRTMRVRFHLHGIIIYGDSGQRDLNSERKVFLKGINFNIREIGGKHAMKKGKSKSKRFVIKEEQGIAGGVVHVIVDGKTGVNYVCVSAIGPPQGITPLLDNNGNVVIDPVQSNPAE